MASVHACLRQFRCTKPALGSQWLPSAAKRAAPSTSLAIRTLTTTTATPANDDTSSFDNNNSLKAQLEAIRIPHVGVVHARAVPSTPSYFARTPQFNDLHIQLARLLARYNHLPTVASAEAAQMPWLRLEAMRHELGESIKASHFSQVMRVVRRLHCIEPSLAPAEVVAAVARFTKPVNALLNVARPRPVDRFGRAVGVGRRKTSTARAFVVEGTGEVLVNGKTLNEAFGRVHDRESAIWALLSTGRLDKYNIWALVEGGGTTGQAEAMTMAVAKGLLAHEPALKPALRKAGCITRDPRRVERKLHGHVKARKSPAWVKR
ncbi:37S ribosomal protein S9 [Cordyceps militaris CM01]|uniref:Small ribosomal subunit protein uS9m n=1 Tax=Cordyceps militaris (strain CM01) TaxID=983644 RepID=G3JCX2_CORMM|nr:37S ribosomal protein S9 [Cordyceps militaris CM01]EGX92500.1 37S ribosomal protein S9 [Cordyceps militaris CM01]